MATMTVPDRSLEQRMSALDKANQVRGDRSCLKREIAAMTRSEGLVYVARLIRERPAELETMRVFSLIASVRTMGRVKAQHVMCRAGGSMPIDPWIRLGELSYKRRDALGSELFRLNRWKEEA